MSRRWLYKIRSFDVRGNLLLETVHASEGSREMEMQAYETRMARGEVAYVDVTDLVNGGTEVIYPTAQADR